MIRIHIPTYEELMSSTDSDKSLSMPPTANQIDLMIHVLKTLAHRGMIESSGQAGVTMAFNINRGADEAIKSGLEQTLKEMSERFDFDPKQVQIVITDGE